MLYPTEGLLKQILGKKKKKHHGTKVRTAHRRPHLIPVFPKSIWPHP